MRIPRTRLWAPPVLAVAVGAVAAAVLAVSGTLAVADAVQLVLLVGIGAGVALLLVTVRRALRRLDRLARSDRAAQDKQLARARTELGHEITGALEMLRTDARERDQRHAEQRSAEIKALKEHVTVQGRRDYEQHVAWLQLRDFVAPGSFMPPLRGWAASPDVLGLIAATIAERRPGLVVECGSGSSSVWLGYALRKAGKGRLIALEHDERYAELSRALIDAHGLTDIVEIRHAPLRDWTPGGGPEAHSQPWYDTDGLDGVDGIGLLFVDGPPAATGPQARYPALPALVARCAPDAVVVLDDTIRAEERAISDRWLAEYPDLRREVVDTEKGAHVLIRGSVS
ncbi:class I SAM-dependent methyltransferase [Nocardiopsis ansamitocini]|uniref:Methyltransferase n=1 Tax=Nocardiopsis ansamitocini TaxID=1670832 RepID=A0A9W6UHB3_9ACTN|nr:class I SAM-dependent methyltransferase [Nocardiopsis ansamitocini]GLU46173.1 hypothetical protein Nans01_05240 [Nocardiopsis ansamitocini]